MSTNQLIINKLTELSNFYKMDSNMKFKYAALNKALHEIKQYPNIIKSGKDAKEHIKHIGEGISKRIDEILSTGTLVELPLNSNNDIDPIKELMRITGVGETRAKNLVKQGINNVEQYKEAIKQGKVKSTHHIDLGIKYLKDLEERIPRVEIEKMEIILRNVLNKLNPKIIFNICGSYRRGCETCGDIDILITDVKNEHHEYLHKYVEELTKCNFLIDHLTKKGDKKYMGICRLSQLHLARRIDIRYVNYEAYYAALIYFTGSRDFNIKIRNKAIELGYSLSEYGLKTKKGVSSGIISINSEEELFKILKIEYVKPTDRNI